MRSRGGIAAALGLGLLLAGCAGDAGTGVVAPLTPVPPEAPRVTGAERTADREHRQLVKAFGGEVRAPQIQALLTEVVNRLVPATDRPDEAYRITILDSPAVNAFALPNGRLYVTRGLLALANDTSEVAAVLAHEIGHVTLRHAAARSELELRSALVSRVVADVLRDPVAGAVVRDEAKVEIARFSRDQELEADQVSVRTLAGAGFDPHGATRFLTSLHRTVELKNGALGEARQAAVDRLSSHPPTPQQISEARLAARRIGAPGLSRESRALYLAALDGLTYGDDPIDGVVRGRRFLHARLGIGFTAPDGFNLENTARAVLGSAESGNARLLFDAVETQEGQDLPGVLATSWSDAVETGSVATTTVNGLPAATAISRGKDWTFRMAAIRTGSATYRLIMAFRNLNNQAERQFQETLQSVHAISPGETSAIRPLRLRVVTAGPGDTAESLAARMSVGDRQLERFLVLNGLDSPSAVRPGERYKIVAE